MFAGFRRIVLRFCNTINIKIAHILDTMGCKTQNFDQFYLEFYGSLAIY